MYSTKKATSMFNNSNRKNSNNDGFGSRRRRQKTAQQTQLHVALSACYCKMTVDFGLVGGHMGVGV